MSGAAGYGGGGIEVIGSRWKQAAADIQRILNFTDLMDWLNAGPRGDGEDGEHLFVTGSRVHNNPPPRASQQPAPASSSPCPTNPTNVDVSGTLTIYGGSAAFARLSVTLTDVSTGRSYTVTAMGAGGGFAAGSYDISGTLPGFASLDKGFGVNFWSIGYGGANIGQGGIHTIGGSYSQIGNTSVNTGLWTAPIGAADVGFRNVSRRLTTPGC